MSVAKLLRTTNLRTLTRALKVYSSYFVSCTDEVFDNFSDYFPFYMFVLNHRSSLSIAYCDLSERLVQEVTHYGPNINAKSINPILTYFYHCFEASNSGFKVDSFVAHTFDPSDTISAIISIFSTASSKDYLEPLLKILAVSKSTKILSLINKYQADVAQIIIEKSDEMIQICLQCLLSLVHDITSFIAKILSGVVTAKPILINHLLPYVGFIQAKISQCPDLKGLNTRIIEYLYKQKLPPPPPDNLSAPLSRILLDQDIFGKQANVSEFNQIISAKPKKSTTYSNAMSLSKRLDKFNNSAPQPTEPAKQEVAPVQPEQPVKEVLEASAFKLGGFQRNTWQNRFFQFYPSNRCLVWRSKKGTPDIKGLLLFDSTIKVDKELKGIKGKQYVMTISIGKKAREIAFQTGEELERWYNAFKASIVNKNT
ncbi:PH domain containing protein [Histomonas meleagridis]|uniref:PH domain containing protein n=1 Tax=Histomonas meleagridis TaxID=135588 RepID=UPI0035594E94|nr:PH domain containing protein [Histomonas meleagridis]KAH0804649.1 PH domain containing protein [Histomonas meleagridis]